MNDIITFDGEYNFLSNFYPAEITYNGIIYPTTEHAFQAAKSLSEDVQKAIAQLETPGLAKKAGRNIDLRDDWNNVRRRVMAEITELKFKNDELRERLLATGLVELIEGNKWNDTFWGVCNGKGSNHLGKILMELRRNIRLDILFETPDDGDCVVHIYSSRGCEKGTKGCVVYHDDINKEWFMSK